MEKLLYDFHPQVIARLPALPFDTEMPINIVEQLIQNAHFLEAIYLASPVLYNECIKYKKGEITDVKETHKIKQSIIKYYQRMYSRCTPFGLFSGCTTLSWSNNKINKSEDNFIAKRHTRLDMHYLCAFAQKIAKEPIIKNRLLYYPNSSYYCIGDEIRYIEYQYKDGQREHQISSIDNSAELKDLLIFIKPGKYINEIKTFLQHKNVESTSIDEFIHALIENQVCIPELEPAITGETFLYQIIKILKKINTDEHTIINDYINSLQLIDVKLKNLDKQIGNENEAYTLITEILLKNELPFELNKLFQTDLFFDLSKKEINTNFQETIQDVLALYSKIYSYNQQSTFKNFISRFTERYEETEIPLLLALDAETGIGYIPNQKKSITPLIDNIPIINNENNTTNYSINSTESLLLKKLIVATEQQKYTIEINEADFKDNKVNSQSLPPSLSCMCRIVDTDTIIIEAFSGSSAANLLGRFTHGSNAINTIVQNITEAESILNDSIIFAEIIHLPESRIGNILLREHSRNYEIPFLAKSSLPISNQISLDDLYISIKNGKIKFRSRNLNKIIIPRLSSAHNYSYNALPAYQFLCDLQNQDIQSGLSFYWGSIANYFNFLPRVTYKKAILQEATWNINKSEIEAIVKDKEAFDNFTLAKKLPQYFVLVDADNELLVNTQSTLSIDAFVHTIKKRQSIQIKEFIIPKTDIFTVTNQKFYCNQLIVPLIKKEAVYNETNVEINNIKDSNRSFVIGSSWLYYKLYCGENDGEKIITQFLLPLIKNLLNTNLVTKFFFIRYTDPHFHLRIRLLISEDKNIYAVIEKCKEIFENLLHTNFIYKIQNDTYARELERYHPTLIENTESLFFVDSMETLTFLSNAENIENESNRSLFAMQKVDTLLCVFNYTLDEKIELCTKLKNGFKAEFQLDKNATNEINKKYAILRPQINIWFNKKINSINKELEDVVSNLIHLIKVNHLHIQDYMPSYIHMVLNKIFITNPRLHEVVL